MKNPRLLTVLLIVLVLCATMTISLPAQNLGHSSNLFVPPGPPPLPPASQFVAVVPCRIMDTRTVERLSPLPPGVPNFVDVVAIAQTNCGYDVSAALAYSLNITLLPQDGQPVRYATLWPAGTDTPPVASIMNSMDGTIKANAAIVGAGVDGGVNLYVTDAANVAIDLNGFFTAPGTSTLAFYPLTPCRVVDTRSGLGGPPLGAEETRDLHVILTDCLKVPSTPKAAAYSINVTVVPPNPGDPLRYLSLWPTGHEPEAPVSTLNNPMGTNVANAALIGAGTAGEVTVYVTDATNLIIDVNGYFAAPTATGASFYPMMPCRLLDTRGGDTTTPISDTLAIDVVNSACAPSALANAYVFNATVVPAPTLDYLTLWPDGMDEMPIVSTLNAPNGAITSNMAIVPNLSGTINAFPQGTTELIMDMSGYFAPLGD